MVIGHTFTIALWLNPERAHHFSSRRRKDGSVLPALSKQESYMNQVTKRERVNTPKSIFLNISLFLISILFALFVGEGFARFIFAAWPFEPKPMELDYLTEKDINLRWRFSPQDGRNTLGLRNREIVPKEGEVFRIMFLGDSLVWSGQTSSGNYYTEVVEENLNNELHLDTRIEVINAGIPGYTTYQELEFLNVYGLGMQPDLVVLGFVFNDVHHKYLHRIGSEQLMDVEPKSRLNRFNVHTFPGKYFSNSYLAHEATYAFQKISSLLGLSPYYSFEHRSDFYLAWKEYGWNDTEILIGEMQRLLLEREIPLIIAIFPVLDQVDSNYLNKDQEYVLYPQSRIKKISESYGISYIDMTDVLYQNGGRVLFSDYLHLNEAGNDVVATEFVDYLSSNLLRYLDK